ncbi:g1353 [Coccomyxa elongata]
MAVMLPREGLSSEAVYEAVTRVLEDDSFRTAAAKLSQRICSRKRMPLQEAADWVEHVLDSDGEPYLQLPDQHMDICVYNSLDVIAAYLAIALSFLSLALCVVWWILDRAFCKFKGLPGWKEKLV